MESISTRDARETISDVANKVAYAEQHVQLTRHGKNVGVWVPDGWYERAAQALARLDEITSDAASDHAA